MSDSAPLLSDWQLHIAKPAHDGQIRALFSQVFGHAITEEEWNWKYAHTGFRGSLLSKNSGELIGFFGGMPRTFVYQGQYFLGVQNGDVMVRARERGIFSRKGAFYQVANHFIKNFIGPESVYAFAFGFPHKRAFQLGIQLGLYQKAGHLQEISWTPKNPHHHWHWYWHSFEGNTNAIIDELWIGMQSSWREYFLPLRNSTYWNWRYQQRRECSTTCSWQLGQHHLRPGLPGRCEPPAALPHELWRGLVCQHSAN